MLAFFWLILVAVTQPGGSPNPIIFDNGTYSVTDFAAAFPADFIDNANGSYRSKVTLQNGDGVSTAATAWVDTGKAVYFDAGKTYLVNAVGQANRTTQWGTKIGTTAAKDGCDLSFGSTPVFKGINNFYGSKIRSSVGINLLTNLGGVPAAGVGELIGNTFQWGNAGGQFGNPTSGQFAVIFNNNFAGVGAAATINGFGADSEDGSIFSGTGLGRFVSTAASQLNLSRPKFIGSPALADIRDTHGSGIDWNFAEPAWSGNAVQFDATSGVAEWWGFGVEVFDSQTKVRVPNIAVELINIFGTTVVDTTTDSEGQITFNSGVSLNRVQLRRHSGGGTVVISEYGPFLLKVNHKGTINYTYETPYQKSVVWPGRNYAQGRQLQNVFLSVSLTNITGSPTPWAERVAP